MIICIFGEENEAENDFIANPAVDNFSIKGFTRPLDSDFTISLKGETRLSFIPEMESAEITAEVSGTDDQAAEEMRFEWSFDKGNILDMEVINNGTAAKVSVKRDAQGKGIEGTDLIIVDAYTSGRYLGRHLLPVSVTLPRISALYCLDEKIRDTKQTVYSGKPVTPPMEANNQEGMTMILNKDYTLAYKNNIKCGVAVVTATTMGDYDPGTKEYNFTIIPEKAQVAKLTRKGSKLTVTIKDQKESGLSGYQIQYRMDGTSKWKSKTLAAGKTKLVLKNLKKGKQYQVRSRGYVKSSGNTYFGEFSEVKKK